MCSFWDGGFQRYTSQITYFNLYKQTKDQSYKKEQHEEGVQSKSTFLTWRTSFLQKVTVAKVLSIMVKKKYPNLSLYFVFNLMFQAFTTKNILPTQIFLHFEGKS